MIAEVIFHGGDKGFISGLKSWIKREITIFITNKFIKVEMRVLDVHERMKLNSFRVGEGSGFDNGAEVSGFKHGDIISDTKTASDVGGGARFSPFIIGIQFRRRSDIFGIIDNNF